MFLSPLVNCCEFPWLEKRHSSGRSGYCLLSAKHIFQDILYDKIEPSDLDCFCFDSGLIATHRSHQVQITKNRSSKYSFDLWSPAGIVWIFALKWPVGHSGPLNLHNRSNCNFCQNTYCGAAGCGRSVTMGGSRNRFSQIGEAGQQRWRVRQNSVIITGPRTVVGSAALLPTNHPGRPTDRPVWLSLVTEV